MKKLKVGIALLFLSVISGIFATSSHAFATTATEPTVGAAIISPQNVTIQLRNTNAVSTDPYKPGVGFMNLDGYSVELRIVGHSDTEDYETTSTTQLANYLKSAAAISIGNQPGADFALPDLQFPTDNFVISSAELTLRNNMSAQIAHIQFSQLDLSNFAAGNAIMYSAKTSAYGALPLTGDGIYAISELPSIKITEVSPESGATFIEIYANETTDLSQLRIHSDYYGATTFTDRNTIPLAGVLEKGQYLVIQTTAKNAALALTNDNARNIWIEDSYGLTQFSQFTYNKVAAGESWALDETGVPAKTGAPSPGQPNIFPPEEIKTTDSAQTPCPAGKERNPETNRCRNIVVAVESAVCAEGQLRNPETGRCKKIVEETAAAACKEGQERNPDTNRCRNIASTAGTLVPCKEGQERNPETNRCRNIVAESTEAKPCPEGQERNPETNRCRKIVEKSAARFAVDEVPASRETGLWVWAGAGIFALVMGMIAWQFRPEIAKFMRRFAKTSAKS